MAVARLVPSRDAGLLFAMLLREIRYVTCLPLHVHAGLLAIDQHADDYIPVHDSSPSVPLL